MKQHPFSFWAFCGGILALVGFFWPRTSLAGPTQHVVVLVMDGARYSETWGDITHTNIPQIAANLARSGVVLTSFYTDITSAISGAKTETNPGHATLACGAYQNIANDGSQLPYEPTLFQYFRKQYGTLSNSAWVVTSKDKLVILSNSSKTGWNGLYRPSYSCGVDGAGGGGYRSDSLTHSIARTCLTNDHPGVMLINYRGPDSMGHANNWSGYVAAIKEVDGYAADLWRVIQTDPVLKDTTTLFITNDHGRHDDAHGGFVNHGDSCEGCRHLLCVVVGPIFAGGKISGARRTQPDLSRTAADLLGVSMPTATGQVMSELYQPPLLRAGGDGASATLLLAWSAAAPAYRLMTSTDLQPGSWTNVPVSPQEVGLEMRVAVPATNGQSFYRLMK